MKQLTPPKRVEEADESQSLKRAVEVIQELHRQIIILKAENKELKDRLSQNSHSTKLLLSGGCDKPKPKSRRRQSGRNSGGQTGYPGSINIRLFSITDR